MGMTIDDAHGILTNGLVNAPSEHEWCVAFELAIETMRKYQKIEQIIKDWHMPTSITTFRAMEMVSEVLKNGNDD